MNDHIRMLNNMADNTTMMSAINRSMVKINGKGGINRVMELLVISIRDN